MNKRITVVVLAVLMFVLALPVNAAIQAQSVEIRGEVWNESTNEVTFWNPQNFAGFFYDLKDDLGSENLTISQTSPALGTGTGETRTIGKSNLTYMTTAQAKKLKAVSELNLTTEADMVAAGLEQAGTGKAFEGGNYYILGWQAERYVAVNGKVDKLAKLILEHGTAAADKKTLTVGEVWDIGDGWTLAANSIDAKATPRQVWLTLSKNGVKKDDKVITTAKPIYTYVEKTLGAETDVPMFVTVVDSVFAGATTDMVQLRYTWLIGSTVTEVKSGDTYGVFKDAEVLTTPPKTLKLKNSDSSVSLTRDTTTTLMGEMKFKVADSTILRFYPMVERTTAGTYEVRGTVWNETTNEVTFWNPQRFAGFFYDLKDDLGSENLTISQTSPALGTNSTASETRTIGKSNLTYMTTAQAKKLKAVSELNLTTESQMVAKGLEQAGTGKAFEGGNYYILGWQAERYVAVNGKVDKLAKLILEHGTAAADKKTLTVGEVWDIGDGWTLAANSIDAKATPRQVWLTLSKSGVKKDDKVITTDKPIYTYVEKTLGAETDVPMFVTVVDSVFAGATTDMVQLRYTWLMGSTVTEVKSGDTYGVFKDAEVLTTPPKTLKLKNSDTTVSLTRDTTTTLMGEMKFKVADSAVLRFYPMVEYQISGPTPTTSPTPVAGTPTVPVNVTVKPPTNVTVTVPPPPVVATITPTPTKKEPGFEAIFAIAGLLAVAFLVLRQRK